MAVLTFPLYNHTSKPRIWQSRRGHDFFAWNISTLTVLYVLLTQGFASLITQKNIIGTSIDDLQTKIACRREANVIMEECLGSRIKPEGSAGIPGKDRLNIFNPIKSKEEDEKEIQSKDKFDGPSQNMDLQEDLITNAIHKAFHRSHLETPEGFEEEKFAEVRKEILESWNQFADFVKRNSNTHPGEKGLKKFQHQSSNIDLKAKKDGSWLSLIEDIHRNIKSLEKMGNKGNTKVEFILNDIIVLFISLVERFDLADRKELGNFLNSEEGQDLIANYSVGKFIEKYPSSLTSLYINYDYEDTLKNSPFTQEIHGILREMDHDSFKYITWLLVEAEFNNQKSNMNLRYLNQMQKDLTQIVKRDHMNLSNKWVNQKKMEFFTEELMEHIYNFKIYNNEFTDEMKTEAAIMHKMLHFLMKYYVESKEVDIIDKIQNSKHYPSMLEFDKAMWSMSESLKSLLSKYQELNQLMTVHPQSKKILNPDYINIYSLADMNNGIKKTLFSEEHEKNYNFELTSLKNRNEEIGVMIEDLFTKWQRRDKMINDQLVETKIDLKDKAPISWLIRKLDGQSFLLSQFWRNDWHVMKKYPDTILLYSSEALKNVMRDIFGNPQNFI